MCYLHFSIYVFKSNIYKFFCRDGLGQFASLPHFLKIYDACKAAYGNYKVRMHSGHLCASLQLACNLICIYIAIDMYLMFVKLMRYCVIKLMWICNVSIYDNLRMNTESSYSVKVVSSSVLGLHALDVSATKVFTYLSSLKLYILV